MLENLFIFGVSLFLIIKGATISTKYSFKIAEKLKISKYIIGFIVVAIISIIPETFVAINTAFQNVPSLGLGTLFGSNIADLTLIFAIIIFVANRGIKVESKILTNNSVYPFFLIVPIVLGLDGFYSRVEGIVLIICGILFYYLSFRRNTLKKEVVEEEEIIEDLSNSNITDKGKVSKSIWGLIFSMILLLVGSHFIVTSSIDIANYLHINSVILGILVLGLGTTIPEFSFCLASIKDNHDSLAVGDLLGTVLADATIVLGLLSLINPFTFPVRIIYVTGTFMVVASFILFYFMKTGKTISKKEGYILLFIWILFIILEITLNG